MAVLFHRQGSLWQSENISCIKIQHALWVQGWGARERGQIPAVASNEHNASPNLQKGKAVFSKCASFPALLNIIHSLRSWGSFPTSLGKAINHSCTFPFSSAFPLHSFPSSSALTSSRGDQEDRTQSHANRVPGLAGPACVHL